MVGPVFLLAFFAAVVNQIALGAGLEFGTVLLFPFPTHMALRGSSSNVLVEGLQVLLAETPCCLEQKLKRHILLHSCIYADSCICHSSSLEQPLECLTQVTRGTGCMNDYIQFDLAFSKTLVFRETYDNLGRESTMITGCIRTCKQVSSGLACSNESRKGPPPGTSALAICSLEVLCVAPASQFCQPAHQLELCNVLHISLQPQLMCTQADEIHEILALLIRVIDLRQETWRVVFNISNWLSYQWPKVLHSVVIDITHVAVLHLDINLHSAERHLC